MRFGIPWQWPAIADIRSWPFTRHRGLKLFFFWKLGTFLGRKAFGWSACDLFGKFRLTIDMIYTSYFDLYSSARRSPMIFERETLISALPPNFFQARFNWFLSDGWANTTGLMHTKGTYSWHKKLSMKLRMDVHGGSVVDDSANLGRIWKTWKTFPKDFFKDTNWLYWWKFIYVRIFIRGLIGWVYLFSNTKSSMDGMLRMKRDGSQAETLFPLAVRAWKRLATPIGPFLVEPWTHNPILRGLTNTWLLTM